MLTALYILLGLVAFILVVALFTRKRYAVLKEITIDAPAQTVFDYLRLLKNQDHYNEFVMMDPAMTKTFTGTDGTPGFVYAWSGNKQAGEGTQTIKAIKGNERIDYQIQFIRPFDGVADVYFTTAPAGNGKTRVQWSFASQMKYPLNIMLLMLNIEGTLGKSVSKSLTNLKGILEGDKVPAPQ